MTLRQRIMVKLLKSEFSKLTITQQTELCNELAATRKMAELAAKARRSRKGAKCYDTASQKQSA